jgi:hypothetical protein
MDLTGRKSQLDKIVIYQICRITIVMAEIKFADVTTVRSIVRLIVMGRLCELCVILLVDSMLVYVFYVRFFTVYVFYAVA